MLAMGSDILGVRAASCQSLRRAGASLGGFVGIIRAMFSYREPFYARFAYARSGSDRPGGRVDRRKLWTGGVVTAVIVFGLTIAAFLFVRGMLNYPLLGIRRSGAVVYASMFGYAGGAALVAPDVALADQQSVRLRQCPDQLEPVPLAVSQQRQDAVLQRALTQLAHRVTCAARFHASQGTMP